MEGKKVFYGEDDMQVDIDFNEEDVHRRLKEHDLSFFEIAVDHASFKKIYFNELIKKWKLKSQNGIKGTKEDDLITYYNDEYSLAITGLNENGDGIPYYYISLTFSKDMKMRDVIEF